MNILVNSIWTKEKFFMINMAVVNVKDVIKYFFKITILIVIILATVKYFSQGKDEIKRKVNEIDNKTLFKILFLNSG